MIIKLTMLVFLLFLPGVLAFVSPSTLTLVSESLKSIILNLFVFLIAYAVILLRFFKKKKKLYLLFLFLGLLIISIIVIIRYSALRQINNVYDEIPLQENEIDLSSISEEELSEFKIIQIMSSISDYVKINNAIYINFYDLTGLLNDLETSSLKYNISKDDKILFICEGGTSKIVADKCNKSGYKAYFAGLQRLRNNDNKVISPVFNHNSKISSSIVVVPFSWKNNNKEDIYFLFEGPYGLEFASLDSKYQVRWVNYTDFDSISINEVNVVCTRNLHCLLTKYLLDYHKIDKINIYKLPQSEEIYNCSIDN
ncbi:hypothetical protein JXB41_07485 [Candidatus Woesearchaeota archaeon]|nr:hypothetical protein [Candidatus Woesearchaeota archaeon]